MWVWRVALLSQGTQYSGTARQKQLYPLFSGTTMQGRLASGNPRFEGVIVLNTAEHQPVTTPVRHGKLLMQSAWAGGITAIPFPAARCLFVASGNGSTPTVE
ncbi:hypothetical protein LTSEURB_6820 [Salmonella enterica subsp. enterica serovar Urbana str. R8-2977]|uniref:Uncharacterized protein n=1 Tax=Salmonella enterica subsp. enterica serovar Urbana str. R8-2977 TaxID=913084 RepID=G5S5K9_SALET|nr:hypothetical protein LTSEURB_6820 [Salmonella enterica subsp. enterica serovar Urbana str. R8-2977]